MGLSFERVTVTPELAQEWLDGMGVNRRLSESNLEAIVLAMKEGHWHDDGTPFRFNEAGALIDGQHRATAVTIVGTPIEAMVVRGVEESAMTTIDTGKSRSRSDVLSIHDPSLTAVTTLSGVASIALRWSNGVRGNALRNAYISNDAFIRFFDGDRDALIHAAKSGARTANRVGGITAQAAGLCAWLFAKIDIEDAEYFWNRMADGAGLSTGNPILAARRFFERESRSNRDNVRADIAAAILIKAWNAYRKGAEVQLLHFKVGGAKPERFPEPV